MFYFVIGLKVGFEKKKRKIKIKERRKEHKK